MEILLCIVDCKFPFIKRAYELPVDDLTRAAKVMIAELGLPKKIISDGGTAFVAD